MALNRKKYDFAFKEKAVLLSYERKSLSKLEKELGLYAGALSQWRREYQKYDNQSSQTNDYLTANLKNQKIQKLERKIKKSDLKFEILKNAGEYLHQDKAAVYCYISNHEKIYSIRLMCDALGIQRNTYQLWKKQLLTETQRRKNMIKKEITAIFSASQQRYGRERITAELKRAGYQVSYTTVNKYMKELGLADKVKKN